MKTKTDSNEKSGKGRFKPSNLSKEQPAKAKSLNAKGQNLGQNTRNQGYQQDR